MIMLAIILAVPIIFLAWAAIHELSHYLVARKYLNIISVDFFLYPHKSKSLGFVWARVKWLADRIPTNYELANISVAPRIPNLIAAIMFTLWSLMPTNILMLLWSGFWIGGLIDLFVGSLGINKQSDLQRVSNGWNLEPWILRVAGMSVVFSSIIISLLIYLLL